MTKADLHHVLNALESADAEFEQLMLDKEWYVTDVVDVIASAKEVVQAELATIK